MTTYVSSHAWRRALLTMYRGQRDAQGRASSDFAFNAHGSTLFFHSPAATGET
jgi:hypothetical protein